MHDAYKEWNCLPNNIEQKSVQFKSYLNSHILAYAERITDLSLLFLTAAHTGFIGVSPADTIEMAPVFQSPLIPDRTAGSLAFNSSALLPPATFSYQLRESGNRIPSRIVCDQRFLVSLA